MVIRYLIPMFLVAFVMLSGNAFAQTFPKERLDSLFSCTKRTNLPGFAVRILSGNEVVYQFQCGNANIRKHIPFTQQSVSNIGSVTKQFTAYCIYLLEERGKLRTTDSIHKYIPELPDFGYPITLKQLLAHTSGLRDYPDMMALINRSTNNALKYEAMMAYLSKHNELNFAPGEQFCYSNTGYMLLASVIERVSGKSYAAFLQEELFDPLEMKTAFVNEGVWDPKLAQVQDYRVDNARKHAAKCHPYRDVPGATGIWCSLEDLAKWNRLFVDHERRKRTSDIIARMETPFSLNDGSNCHYGGGLILKNYRGERVIEHSGGWGEYLTQYRRFPSEGLTILIFTNSTMDSPFEICDKISNLLISFDDKAVPEPAFTEGFTLSEMNGTYISPDNIVRHIRGDDSLHQLRVYNFSKTVCNVYTLQSVESLADQTTGLFFRDSSGNELVFHFLADSTKQFVWYAGTYFQTKRIYTAVADFNYMDANFTGHYISRELNRSVRIRYNCKQQKLSLILYRLIRYPLEPLGQNVYQVSIDDDLYLLRFNEDGFVFGNDWVYNLHVKKK